MDEEHARWLLDLANKPLYELKELRHDLRSHKNLDEFAQRIGKSREQAEESMNRFAEFLERRIHMIEHGVPPTPPEVMQAAEKLVVELHKMALHAAKVEVNLGIVQALLLLDEHGGDAGRAADAVMRGDTPKELQHDNDKGSSEA